MDSGSGMGQEKEDNLTQPTQTDVPDSNAAGPKAETTSQTTVLDSDLSDKSDSGGAKAETTSSEPESFVGDLSFLKELTAKSASRSAHKGGISVVVSRPVYMILAANILLMLILVGAVWFQPIKIVGFGLAETPPAAQVQPSNHANLAASAPAPASTQNPPDVTSEVKPDELAGVIEKAVLSPEEQEHFGQGVSLKTADDLFAAKEYLKACYVYHQISLNWISSDPDSEYLKDYLKLRMAVCLHYAGEAHAQERYFSQALQSRSAYVRGMACYYLARIRFQNKEYLQARKNAYQAVALWRAFEGMVSTNLEADLYFLIADSLTRQVVGFYNMDQALPGQGWSEQLTDVWPAESDTLRLQKAFSLTAEKVGEGAGGPRLTVDTHRPVGSQWSLVCLYSPLEETLWKAVSETGLKTAWKTDLQTMRSRPVTAYLTYVPQQYMMEVLCGSVGLLWRFDGQNASILNPESYTDFEGHRNELIQEAISLWQRFLLRYRDDRRSPNAHYALGRMYTFAGQFSAALGEFKLLEARFAQNPIAPYAYLEASKIKVEIKDYEGARIDLNEMLLQYPDCPIADEATLYLACATLESGQPDRAKDLFHKAFQMNLSEGGKCEAALGLGRCAYAQQDWAQSQVWLSRAMELMGDKNDSRVGPACFMLGRTYIALGQYVKASEALRIALGGRLSEKESVQIILELVQAESRQQNYLEAMNILESVPQSHLGQQDSCELLIAKAGILREIDAADSAVSLLRRKVEFIADSRLRAWLTLELAKCYLATGDYALARQEINDILADIQDPVRVRQAQLILARAAEKLGQPDQAETFCIAILTSPQTESEIQNEAFNVLGRVYAGQKRYEKAALAFAGILSGGGNKP